MGFGCRPENKVMCRKKDSENEEIELLASDEEKIIIKFQSKRKDLQPFSHFSRTLSNLFFAVVHF